MGWNYVIVIGTTDLVWHISLLFLIHSISKKRSVHYAPVLILSVNILDVIESILILFNNLAQIKFRRNWTIGLPLLLLLISTAHIHIFIAFNLSHSIFIWNSANVIYIYIIIRFTIIFVSFLIWINLITSV